MATPRTGAAAALVLAALAAAASCASDEPALRRSALLERAADEVHAIVDAAVRRAHDAVDGVGRALADAGADRAARFAALEALRVRTKVDGLTWDQPGGEGVWAGEPVEPRDLPAPPPWEASFRSGDTTYHAGPFVRALVVSRDGAGGGIAEATVYLRAPGEAPTQIPAETRWASDLRVKAVRLLPGDAGGAPGSEALRRSVLDPHPPYEPLAVVEVESPGDEAIGEMAREEGRRVAGFLWLAGLAAGVVVAVVLLRRAPARERALGLAAVAILARAALRAIDLPERFRALQPAFRASDFGVAGYLDWLSSPGELLLTALAALAAAAALARAARDVDPRHALPRAAWVAAGVVASAAVSLGWLLLVKVAAVNTQLDYFRPGRLLPSLARGLVLSGLVAATAAAYLVSSAALRAASAALGRAPRTGAAALAGLAALLAFLARPSEFPAWAPLLVPLASGLVLLAAPRGVRPGPASRVLLTSVLATGLLFPALWVRLAEASRDEIPSDVSMLVAREEVVASDLRVDLESLAGDPHLRDALGRAAAGEPPPDGLALYAWQRIALGARPEGGAVFVLDERGRTIDRFWLDTPPASRLPGPTAASLEWDGDVAVSAGVESFEKVRSVVGTVRVRDAEGRERGRVVVVVPDRLSTELEGLRARPVSSGEEDESAVEAQLALTLVRDGRVVATNEPALPRTAFPALAEASRLEKPCWVPDVDGGAERFAMPLPAGRGVLLARRARAPEHVFLALARAAIVGVGVGTALALAVFLAGLRRFRPGLAHRILLSYFAISVVPLVLLAAATLRSTATRHERLFRERHALLVSSAREDFAALGASLFDSAAEGTRLEAYAGQRGIDVSLYREGGIVGSSLWPQIEADLLPARLPAEAYRATEVEGRDTLGREERFAGRAVRVAYAPIRDERGRPIATIAVPLLHDTEQADREAAETASVLLATYLLTLVLVVVVGIYLARGIARPIDLLAEGTKRVAAGEEDVVLPEAGGAEMASLVAAFNRMTRDLKAVRERAARAERDAAWKGMARQVAHEIKNPLTPMQLLLQHLVALSKDDPAAAREALEPTAKVVLEQIDALRRIAGDFASFAGTPRRVVADVDVNVLLASLGTLYAGGAPGHVRVETALAASLPPVRADADELRRAFVNLLANAMEAISPARPGRVVLRSERARGADGREGVRISVEDTGAGMPPETMARLFEPAFSTKSSGTGLGLAIVRRIVTDLSGTVGLESEPGEGTTVSVWLPAASA